MKTLSHNLQNVEGWLLDQESLISFQENTYVSGKIPLRACGCGVKIDLDHIVYPALQTLNERFNTSYNNQVNKRRDSFSIQKKFKKLHRKVYSNPDWGVVLDDLSQLFKTQKIEVLVELYSASFNLYRDFDKLKDKFINDQTALADLFQNLKTELQKQNSDFNLSLGKGHSIQGGVNFICMDFLEFGEDQDEFILCNNDTIVTGDSVLEPHSPVSVFIALNNALNDLFIYGGHEDLKIYPVYDGNADQVKAFRECFSYYQEFMKSRNVNLEIIDMGPLGVGAHLIGATVIGQTSKRPTEYTNVSANEKILLTHHLGDLGLLAIHRSQYIASAVTAEIALQRTAVIQKLTSPHWLLSQIISEFLPPALGKFVPEQHISFVSDISGPGLSVLNEVVEESSVNIELSDLVFSNDEILNYPRKNYTTSTNGPWIIIGIAAVMERLQERLFSAGFLEAHFIGKVTGTSDQPEIVVSKALKNRFSKPRFKHDLFTPNILVQTENGAITLECPLFNCTQFR